MTSLSKKRLDNGLGVSSRPANTDNVRPSKPQPTIHAPKQKNISNNHTLKPVKSTPPVPFSSHAKKTVKASIESKPNSAPKRISAKENKQKQGLMTNIPLCTLPPTHTPLGLNSPRPFYESNMRTPPVQLQHALTLCHTCHLPILCGILIRTSLESMSPSWHAKCFKCGTCDRRLTSIPFFNKDNALYCAADYQALFGVQCHGCLKPITEAYQSAMGKQYHMGHFLCYQCKTPFKNEDSFKVHKGQAYCEHHSIVFQDEMSS
ncbi:hypothetical protein CLU79DRAFT_763022 [Phycomyces nitens]|nr:hypothetical protein CLU79DRAFT_763022 [Phycomyces nitens]